MPIHAPVPESKWPLAPEGLHQAVCCDVWEPWSEEDKFNPGRIKDKTRIVWQIDQKDEQTGRPVEVSQVYTFSLHEKAKLCQHLESWRGRPYRDDEEKRKFDLEKLIGVNCQLQIVHNISQNSKTYANVQAIVPLGKGMTAIRVSEDYVRRKDRAKKNGGADQFEAADSDVPF